MRNTILTVAIIAVLIAVILIVGINSDPEPDETSFATPISTRTVAESQLPEANDYPEQTAKETDVEIIGNEVENGTQVSTGVTAPTKTVEKPVIEVPNETDNPIKDEPAGDKAGTASSSDDVIGRIAF